MIKEENRENFSNKDELVEQMVNKTYKRMREMGEFETVHQIFGKLPVSRIEKEQYQFLFDSVKQNVDQIVNRQDTLQKILERQVEIVKKIQIKSYKDNRNRLLDKQNEVKSDLITLSNYDFDHLVENVYNEKLPSGKPIFKCCSWMRKQDIRKGKEIIGEQAPFIPDQQYIDLKAIKQEIGDIRMLLEDEPPLKKFDLEFTDENRVQFKSRNFPNNYEIQKRAETLAKIYLLHLYRDEGRKAKQIYKNNEIEMNKQRQIRKIKQQMDVEKVKQGEMIEEMDLIKQVYKILMLIEKKMNELAFAEFNNKNGEKATLIKRSLEKIKQIVHEQPSARNKLKILITYKHKKGW